MKTLKEKTTINDCVGFHYLGFHLIPPCSGLEEALREIPGAGRCSSAPIACSGQALSSSSPNTVQSSPRERN